MVVLPAPTAVILPLLTVATRVLPLLQLTFWPPGDVVAVIVSLSPTYREEMLYRESVIPLLLTVTWQVSV